MAIGNPHRRRSVALAIFLTLVSTVSAHSWIEYAYKLAPNGTMIGDIGYPRGYLPRNSTDPVWKDIIPEWLLPLAGNSAYSGDEIINEYSYTPNPQYPMLEAAPGDHVALIHLENGHVTLPQNQPFKPQNRGTIYLYGTSKPHPQEKLFDVHLLWNQDGTGGDKRGKLLATRNYDDGQCYQPNDGTIAMQRSAELAPLGAQHEQELGCQSDVKLPTDLQPGSVYTIYWYWDWPDLNPAKIDPKTTTNGQYPWAGSFMRGDKVPKGWTMDMISKNESYSSSIDIKITDKAMGVTAKDQSFIQSQDVYKMGVHDQMASNYQVEVGSGGNSGNGGSQSSVPSDTTSIPATTVKVPSTQTGGAGSSGGVTTVTVYSTVPPTTLVTTVFVTLPAGDATSNEKATQTNSRKVLPTSTVVVTKTVHVPDGGSQTPPSSTKPLPTSTVLVTQTVHVPAGGGGQSSQPTPAALPKLRMRRGPWSFGYH